MTTRAHTLAGRSTQPGHDRTFLRSESLFVTTARDILQGRWEVIEKPTELRDLFPARNADERDLGIEPEAAIISPRTGRRFFVEVKKQGDAGNADERAAKHHTVAFHRLMHQRYGYDYHPYTTVFCEALATNPRYTRKIPHYFEEGQYLLWEDYRPELLGQWLEDRCTTWLG